MPSSSSPIGSRRLRPALLGMVSAATLMAATGTVLPFPAVAQTAAPAQSSSFDRSYAALVQRVLPAVVNVSVEKNERVEGGQASPGVPDNPDLQRFFERFFGQPFPGPQQGPPQGGQRSRGEGSGFVIDRTGHIVTNAHVVGGASKITVVLQDGEQLPAELVGIDEKTDLAVIKVEAGKVPTFVTWGDSDEVRVGDKILAVGNPFGLGGTVTSGIISATGRELGAGPYDDFLQVDAAINRGNSGGPTFDLDGRVLGVNSVIFSPSGGSVGIGFAISSNLAREVTGELIRNGSVTRGWLGVGIQQVTPDLAQSLGLARPEGALVTNVTDDSPAAKAGLRTGDVITRLDGNEIKRVRELTRAVADLDPGRSAELRVWREGKERSLSVAIGAMPTSEQVAAVTPGAETGQPRLGLSLAGLTPELRRELGLDAGVKGVLIREVRDGSPAGEKGLQPGDVILRIGQMEVGSPEQATRLIREAQDKGGKSVLILFQREGTQLFAAVPFAVS